MSVNKVILVGNLGKDPEVRTFKNGGKVCSFRLATSETWKDKASGERKERTEWHTVSIFNEGLVKVAEQYLRKGSKVYLQGSLETRKFQDSSGVEKSVTEVVLRQYGGEMVMLDGRAEKSDAGSLGSYQAPFPRIEGGGAPAWGQAEEAEDVIPF